MDSPTSILRPSRADGGTEPTPADTSVRGQAERRNTDVIVVGDRQQGEDSLAVSASQYHVIGEIGRGGIGTVYLARDDELDRFVAVKRLGPMYADNPWMTERLFREARSIAALSHANIVQVYALGKDAQGPFIVMEYVPGSVGPVTAERPRPPMSLYEKVAMDGPLSNGDAIGVMLKLCDAVAYAHRRGVIHRDLKPANILIDETGEAKVVDFGLARRWDSGEPRLTGVGTQLISLGYGAPEQERDASQADARADIYALGGVLFFALTGENPRFFRENKLPSHLVPPVLKAMAKLPDERWQTAKEFEQALRAAAPALLSLKPVSTDSGMWRCEWCHTSNSLHSRFCSECGWDGQRRCPECDAETRVGVRFCPVCGTDIKEFEDVRRLVGAVEENLHQKSYAMVLSHAEGLRGFRPRKEPGHALGRRIKRAKAAAQDAIDRIEILGREVDKAMQVGNYELVEQRVREYDSLCDDDRYAAVKEDLPEKVRLWRVSTQLDQAKKMLRVSNWDGAECCCRKVLEELDATQVEARTLLHRLVRRKYGLRAVWALVTGVLVAALYVLSVFPSLHLARQSSNPDAVRAVRKAYAPVLTSRASAWLRKPLDSLGEALGVPLTEEGGEPPE